MTPTRWVCLDVGETLIDETRVWSTWADRLGVPRLTFLAALGAVIARGGDYRDGLRTFGFDDWPLRLESVEAAYGGFRAEDLYPDALRAIDALRERGYEVAIVANQPAERADQLRALGIDVDVVAMSGGLGVAKPSPAFFARVLELIGSPDPGTLPTSATGSTTTCCRRGPRACGPSGFVAGRGA